MSWGEVRTDGFQMAASGAKECVWITRKMARCRGEPPHNILKYPFVSERKYHTHEKSATGFAALQQCLGCMVPGPWCETDHG